MSYLIINLTNYGNGYHTLGTTRSRKKAWEIAEALQDATIDTHEHGQDSWTVLQLESIDKYTDESLIEFAKQNLMVKEDDNEN